MLNCVRKGRLEELRAGCLTNSWNDTIAAFQYLERETQDCSDPAVILSILSCDLMRAVGQAIHCLENAIFPTIDKSRILLKRKQCDWYLLVTLPNSEECWEIEEQAPFCCPWTLVFLSTTRIACSWGAWPSCTCQSTAIAGVVWATTTLQPEVAWENSSMNHAIKASRTSLIICFVQSDAA